MPSINSGNRPIPAHRQPLSSHFAELVTKGPINNALISMTALISLIVNCAFNDAR